MTENKKGTKKKHFLIQGGIYQMGYRTCPLCHSNNDFPKLDNPIHIVE